MVRVHILSADKTDGILIVKLKKGQELKLQYALKQQYRDLLSSELLQRKESVKSMPSGHLCAALHINSSLLLR